MDAYVDTSHRICDDNGQKNRKESVDIDYDQVNLNSRNRSDGKSNENNIVRKQLTTKLRFDARFTHSKCILKCIV